MQFQVFFFFFLLIFFLKTLILTQIGSIRGCFGTFWTKLAYIGPNQNREKKNHSGHACNRVDSSTMRLCVSDAGAPVLPSYQVYVDRSLLTAPFKMQF